MQGRGIYCAGKEYRYMDRALTEDLCWGSACLNAIAEART